MVRLPHPQSGDSQGQETFLAPSADKQTCNYDTECSNHHPSLSTPRQDEMVNHIYTNLPVNAIVRLVRVKKTTTAYVVKYFGLSALSVTLSSTIKVTQENTIIFTTIINATIGIK